MRLKGGILCAFVALLSLGGCYKDHFGLPPSPAPERGSIYSIEKVFGMSLSEATVAVNDTLVARKLRYGIDFYKVRYWTLHETDIVRTAALFAVPRLEEGTRHRLAAYFHGTIIPLDLPVLTSSLPSEYQGGWCIKDISYCVIPLASAGFCVVAPDYTGYGETSDRDHPFIYYPELFKSCLDGLYAARKVADSLGLDMVEKDIWLTGWSQGGGAALYVQRELEKSYTDDFTVKATSTLAGPFNIRHFMQDVMDNPTTIYPAIALYSWAGYAMNRFSPQMKRPSDQVFRVPIYSQSSSFLMMSTTPEELFQDFFMQNIRNGKDTQFLRTMEDCSTCSGWTPRAKVYLHHGTDDPIVPFFNAEDAYMGLKGSGNVELHAKKGGVHDSFVPEFIYHTIEELEANR